jgi:hypothetical protein
MIARASRKLLNTYLIPLKPHFFGSTEHDWVRTLWNCDADQNREKKEAVSKDAKARCPKCDRRSWCRSNNMDTRRQSWLRAQSAARSLLRAHSHFRCGETISSAPFSMIAGCRTGSAISAAPRSSSRALAEFWREAGPDAGGAYQIPVCPNHSPQSPLPLAIARIKWLKGRAFWRDRCQPRRDP